MTTPISGTFFIAFFLKRLFCTFFCEDSFHFLLQNTVWPSPRPHPPALISCIHRPPEPTQKGFYHTRVAEKFLCSRSFGDYSTHLIANSGNPRQYLAKLQKPCPSLVLCVAAAAHFAAVSSVGPKPNVINQSMMS